MSFHIMRLLPKYLRLALALVLGAGSMLASHAYESTKAERNLVHDGNKAFNDGNYAKALDYYNKALIASPGSEFAAFNRATALSKLSSTPEDSTFREAISIYENLGQAASNVTIKEKANFNLGNMAFQQQDYPTSIEFYKETLRINPSNTRARENLRVAQLKMPPQDENQDNQDQQQDQQQQEQDQQQDQQQQEQEQQQQPDLSNNAEQILQTMQNRENQTREKTKETEVPTGQRTTDKPW